jgi:hypothetical protein
MFFHAASLDKPERFAPTAAVWTHGRQPWDHLEPTLPLTGG